MTHKYKAFTHWKFQFNSTLRACPDPCLLQPLVNVQIPWFQAQSLHFLMHFTSHPVVHVVVHILLIVIKKLPNPMSFCQKNHVSRVTIPCSSIFYIFQVPNPRCLSLCKPQELSCNFSLSCRARITDSAVGSTSWELDLGRHGFSEEKWWVQHQSCSKILA